MITRSLFFIFTLFVVSIYSQQEKIKRFSIDDGLPSNIIYSITQDKIGYLYIATEKGIVKFDGDDFIPLNSKKANYITSINDKIYAGLENNLLIQDYYKNTITTKEVNQVVVYDDVIFLATNQGIASLKNNFITPITINSQLDFSIINNILYHNNSFYIASINGLWKTDSLENPYKIKKLIEDEIISLDIFNSKLSATTINDGIKIFKDDKLVQHVNTITKVTSAKKIRNEFWITSKENGVEIYTLPSFSFKQKINKYNSLIPNNINTVFKDKENIVWIGTEKGLYQIKNRFESSKSSLKIHFENIYINNTPIDVKQFKSKIQQLSSTENNISIDFKTVDITYPNQIQYRYKLSKKFSSWSYKNNVQLANLDYGSYQFSIQSKLGKQESVIKSILFKVDKPFYLKFWFQLGVVIIILLIAIAYLNSYIKKIQKQNDNKIEKLKRERYLITLEQKALQLQMNPHFIFNVLNGIKALGNSDKKEELNTTISQFSSLLRSLLNSSMKDTISLKDEIEYLTNYLELEKRMNTKDLQYYFHQNLNGIDAEEILIPTMLLQPFIENSVKHAFTNRDSGKINIYFTVKNYFIEFTIIDDGIGFKQTQKNKTTTSHSSAALKITAERIKNSTPKSKYTITEILYNKEIKGTKVYFKIPLITDF
ncbi:sensor histidine kinase [Polaribacter porphyrae]|uniref:Signal transduction histidine kinase internal region domain-containing protein n=1 Tax=Polaribacter porphyrae TaxID=1137780 RepID=A0A2S7WL97_9FLAO|nr:histidine kinase [Polaribacter porphyrae]PQJ78387.1 hypothetical protein BTO18_03900 [Polaribacter porphyrae]